MVHAVLDVRLADELNGGGLSTSPSWPWIQDPGGANTSLRRTGVNITLCVLGRSSRASQPLPTALRLVRAAHAVTQPSVDHSPPFIPTVALA